MLLYYTSATGNIGQELLDFSDFKVYKLWQHCYLYFSFSLLAPAFFSPPLLFSFYSVPFTLASCFPFPLSSPYLILTLESCYKRQLKIKGPEKLPYVYQHIFHSRVFIRWDTSIQKMHMCVQMSRHKCLHAHIVCENTRTARLRACPYACRLFLFFFPPFCSLGEICRLDASGWLCALRSVSGWIMGASGSASGSGNSKCVKRRDCPGSARNIGQGSKRAARQTPRLSHGPPGQEKHAAHFCWPLARVWITDCHPGIPVTFSQQLKVQKHFSRCLKSSCTLDLVTDCTWSHWAGWSGAGLLLFKTPWF